MKDAQTTRVAITGSTGLVGTELVGSLTAGGHEVVRLVRGTPRPDSNDQRWNPSAGELSPEAFLGVSAVVHLAGKNIASGRWNDERKKAIRGSRVDGTRLLSTVLARLEQPPKVLVCASAIGIYGDRGSEELTETSPPGTGFLADVCQAWEASADSARQAGIRVVHLRFGMILARAGGALAKMLTPFKLGAGGRLGSGRQYMSWISLSDVIAAIRHCLDHAELEGPVNTVAPSPVTNTEFTKTLGHVLHRPTIFPMPAFAVKTVFGEMGEELLLASARVLPTRLPSAGFSFQHPLLEDALRHELSKPA